MLHLDASGIDVYPALLLGIGFIIGLFGGLLGLGGGWLVVPSLGVMGMPAVFCVGTSLGAMVVSSAVGALKHRLRGSVKGRLGTLLGLASIAGVELGKLVLLGFARLGVAEIALRVMYLLLLSILWATMVRSLRKGSSTSSPASNASRVLRAGEQEDLRLPDAPSPSPVRQTRLGKTTIRVLPVHIIGIGTLTGVLSGILGIGGGIVLVPLLSALFRLPVTTAVGTSLTCVLISSCYGLATYAWHDHVDYAAAGLIACGAIFGTYLGAHFGHRAPERQLRKVFSIQVMCTAVSVALMLLEEFVASQIVLFGGAALLTIGTVTLLVKGKPESEVQPVR